MKNVDQNDIIYPTNKYQTTLDSRLKASVPEEVWMKLMEFIGTVAFVKELVSDKRKVVTDLPFMEDGKRRKISPDVPHVLENMEYFIQSRIHFEKHGVYTFAKSSSNPTSPYKVFWDREIERCIHGMVREDGEWIPGYLYFYWNYGRIQLTKEEKGSKRSGTGKVRAIRYESFPDIWEADYFFFHYIDQAEESGSYASLLKCRGVGFSFKASVMTLRNFFLIRKSKSFVTAYLENYLFEDGIMNKVLEGEAFIQKHTAFRKRKLISGLEKIKAGFKDKQNNNAQSGYLSEVVAVNVRNPQAIRGKRGKLIIHEEAGSNKGLITAWTIADKSLDDRDNVFGMQLAAGTGGDKNSDFEGLSKLFFQPTTYSVYAIRNAFDKNAFTQASGFFIGEYMNRPMSYNSSGVTDVVKNLLKIFLHRHKLEQTLDDPEELAKRKAEGAITPREAIVTMKESVFPKDLVKEREMEISNNMIEVTKHHHIGRLTRVGQKVQFTTRAMVRPIYDYPYVGGNAANAAMSIKSMPETFSNGEIPSMRYIMGVDTLDDDGGQGSLFSFQVMDLWKDEIVAWYIGRQLMVEDDWDMVLATAIHYNALVNYEANFKGLYGHFKKFNALKYLCDTPQILLDKAMVGGAVRIGNKTKGTRATKPINVWGRQLQADWLRAPHSYYENMRGVDTVDDIEWLREIGMFDPDNGNFDKISSGNMLFILRENLVQVTKSHKFEEYEQKVEYEEDDFFGEFDDIIVGSTDLDF